MKKKTLKSVLFSGHLSALTNSFRIVSTWTLLYDSGAIVISRRHLCLCFHPDTASQSRHFSQSRLPSVISGIRTRLPPSFRADAGRVFGESVPVDYRRYSASVLAGNAAKQSPTDLGHTAGATTNEQTLAGLGKGREGSAGIRHLREIIKRLLRIRK